MICEQELPTVQEILKKGIVGVTLTKRGFGVVVVVVVVSWTALLSPSPNGFEVITKVFKGRPKLNGRDVVVDVVLVVVTSLTALLTELPKPNGFDVTMIDLNGRPRESRR